MRRLSLKLFLATTLLATACVTINVYFPAAQAEKAADRIISDVWGTEPAQNEDQPQGRLQLQEWGPDAAGVVRLASLSVLDFLVPPAAAQADFDIETPEIRALTASMNARHRELKPHYDSGAIGLTADGLVDIRDRNLVPLAERNALRQLVDAENRDRNALCRAIALANGQPGWEAEIRKTFAERWISRAEPGWWYRTAAGKWEQK
jgi:uncharacterized protein YdbL (DUF1318 family)